MCYSTYLEVRKQLYGVSSLLPFFYVGSKAGTCPEVCVARTFTCQAIYFPSPSFLFDDIK